MSSQFDIASLTATDPITGAPLTGAIDPFASSPTNSPTSADASTSWSSLDSIGSNVSGVAQNILSSFGNLVSAQVNAAALKATGQVGAPTTNAPAPNPNSWVKYVGIGVVVVAIGFGVYLFRHSK